MNVPSKDFGEKVEVQEHVPSIEARELSEWIARGDDLVILDTRTPEEYSRFCIPGGRSACRTASCRTGSARSCASGRTRG